MKPSRNAQRKISILFSHPSKSISHPSKSISHTPKSISHPSKSISHTPKSISHTSKSISHLFVSYFHTFVSDFAVLSNNGLSIQSGKIVSVNKGKWDKSEGFEYINNFNRQWLSLVRDKMKDNATIWISGTMHNIFSIGQILTELDFKILNVITWEKNNPPPNFSCRFFTHSTEQIIWARKKEKVPHYYNYELMKQLNGDKQMKDVWKLPAIARWEKTPGKTSNTKTAFCFNPFNISIHTTGSMDIRSVCR